MRVDLESFEQLYQGAPDPWQFTSSPYEQRKYDITVDSLPRRDYRRCFEPGCSIGALTERLATVCDEVVAMDTAPTAVAAAAARLGGLDGVSFSIGTIPEQWPTGDFDLIVFSEIGYYWDANSWSNVVELGRDNLRTGGHIIGVHWLGHSPDHVLNGRDVHETLEGVLGAPIVSHRDQRFILDVWEPS